MDRETKLYIVEHYPTLFTMKEKLANKYHTMLIKALPGSDELKVTAIRLWGEKDIEVHQLFDLGYDNFITYIATKLLAEHPDEIVINKCPVCSKLARTPNARQCRHCGHNWH